MQINITANKVTITQTDTINTGEYNVSPCNFTFSEEYNNLIKKAVFTAKNNQSYLVDINNNQCIIPEEVLKMQGNVILGVYGYQNNDGQLALRYSPSPAKFFVSSGSFIDDTKITIPPKELADLYDRVNNIVNEVQQKLDDGDFDGVGIQNIVFNQDYTMTIFLTDGSQYTSPVLKGDTGQPGYTPQRGVDYWTNEDKQEIIGDITPLIPTDLKDLNDDTAHRLVTDTEKTTWNNKSDFSGNYNDLSNKPDLSSFITKDVNNLTYYTLKTNTGSLIDLEINGTTYVVTLSLKDQDGNVISTDTIDLPLESVVVGGSYDATNQKIVLTLENGNTVDIPVGALISGLQTEITSQNKLASDLVDDSNSGNKFVTTSEKSTWNGKYEKPSGGIPSTDMSSAVQTSLSKADSAVQDVSGKEDKINKVTSISSESTDTQYPTAKCVYDIIGNLETILETLDTGGGVE